MGLIQGALIWADKRSNWIFYCLQYVFMGLFSIATHLYGDLTNCVVYIIVGAAGWFLWNSKTSPPIKHCSWKERGIYLVILTALSIFLYLLLRRTNDPLPLLDTMTTVGGYVATYYMVSKKVDAWVLWFVIDVLYMIEYYLLPDKAWFLIAMNTIWAVMAVGSFISWNKKAKEATV